MFLTELAVRLINLIAPKQCAMCGCRLAIGEDVVCTSCNISLPRTHYSKTPYDNEMAKLFWGLMPIERAAALFFFMPQSQTSRIIYDLKYHDHPEIGLFMGRMTAVEFAPDDFFKDIDAIVPMPLARKRKRQRGYNQSMEIARGISEITKIPIVEKAVKRRSYKGSQTHLHRWQRLENVENAFVLKDGSAIAGKHLLLIDDVVTTGSTIISCASELQKAGNVKFSVLSLGFTKS